MPRPAVNLEPDPDGAGRGWSGLVGDICVPYSELKILESLGSSGISGVPILWMILVIQWIIGFDLDN